jgi:hypothetical protein
MSAVRTIVDAGCRMPDAGRWMAGQNRNPKSEIRDNSEARNPKLADFRHQLSPQTVRTRGWSGFRSSAFAFRVPVLSPFPASCIPTAASIRHPSFVIRHS